MVHTCFCMSKDKQTVSRNRRMNRIVRESDICSWRLAHWRPDEGFNETKWFRKCSNALHSKSTHTKIIDFLRRLRVESDECWVLALKRFYVPWNDFVRYGCAYVLKMHPTSIKYSNKQQRLNLIGIPSGVHSFISLGLFRVLEWRVGKYIDVQPNRRECNKMFWVSFTIFSTE